MGEAAAVGVIEGAFVAVEVRVALGVVGRVVAVRVGSAVCVAEGKGEPRTTRTEKSLAVRVGVWLAVWVGEPGNTVQGLPSHSDPTRIASEPAPTRSFHIPEDGGGSSTRRRAPQIGQLFCASETRAPQDGQCSDSVSLSSSRPHAGHMMASRGNRASQSGHLASFFATSGMKARTAYAPF